MRFCRRASSRSWCSWRSRSRSASSARSAASSSARIERAAAAHTASVEHVPNQCLRGVDNSLKVCCDWASKEKHPRLPVCTCDAANFKAFVCAPVGPKENVVVEATGGAVTGQEQPFDPLDEATWPSREVADPATWVQEA